MARSLQAYVTRQAERRPQAPANANGKVDRVALRALFAEEMADGPE